MDENKFTPTAEEALQLAQEAAGELGHGYMGTEHLLLGLMREDEGLVHTVLTEAGLTDDLLTEMIRKSAGTGLSGSTSASATFSMPHNSIFMKNIAMLAVMNFRAPLRPQCAPRYMHIMLLGPGVMQVITIYSISGA